MSMLGPEKLGDRPHDEPVERFRAFAVRLLLERLEIEFGMQARAHASETAASPPSELTSATPRLRRR